MESFLVEDVEAPLIALLHHSEVPPSTSGSSSVHPKDFTEFPHQLLEGLSFPTILEGLVAWLVGVSISDQI